MAANKIDLNSLVGKRVLVTGATGLIGGALVERLLSVDGINVLALARNEAKARKAFCRHADNPRLSFIFTDIRDLKAEKLDVDYIIHTACTTSSKAFSDTPVETILSTIDGMHKVLELARVNSVKGFVYLSTLEVYGTPTTDDKISETTPSDLLTSSPRSSYPEAKRLCENLGASYCSEYGVPVKTVRLCQTFGEGVDYNDGRVFAEFARCVIEGRDIVLNTKGETKRSYLYLGDAVEAILTVLLRGASGEIYNAANESTYCSIYEMACAVADAFGGGKTSVRVNPVSDIQKFGYAPTLKINLDCTKLASLGWSASVDLLGAYKKMIDYMRSKMAE